MIHSNRHLVATLEALPIPVAIIRREDGLILFANRRLAETMRVPLESLTGHLSLGFYVEPSNLRLLLEQLDREGCVRDLELAVRLGDGSEAYLSLWVEPMEFDGQACNLTSAIDVTARREAERRVTSEQQVLRRLVQLTERDRQLLGFELHDGLVQEITAALMFVQAAAAEAQSTLGRASEPLAACEPLLRSAIDEARRLIGGLQPPNLDEGGVLTAIERLVQSLRDSDCPKIVFTHQLKGHKFVPALERAVFRIVQEALHNAASHSRAQQITVAITADDAWVRVSIEDDGVGFQPTQVPRRRYGLVGIRERARLLGGHAIVESHLGKGTRIVVELPVHDTLMTNEPI